jgi:hypothetical protein
VSNTAAAAAAAAAGKDVALLVAASNASNAADGVLVRLQLVDQLPLSWQRMYDSGAGAAGSVSCSSQGSGGGLCISAAGAASIVDVTMRYNKAGIGGAVFASAACEPVRSDNITYRPESGDCLLQMAGLQASGNEAEEAGGALYSSTPLSLVLADSTADLENSATFSALRQYETRRSLQQLARENTVAEGGYGAGAASFPVQISLLASMADQAAAMARSSSSSSAAGAGDAGKPIAAADTNGKPQQQQEQYVGRKMLQARASYDAGGGIYAALQKESTGLYRETAGATDAASLQGNKDGLCCIAAAAAC